MGIFNLKKMFNEVYEIIPLRKYKGKYLLIDGNFILYQKCLEEINNSNNNKNSVVYTLFVFVINIIERGIIPIFVFDGYYPIEKLNTIKKRKEKREIAKKICLECIDKKSDEYTKNLKKSFFIESKDFNLCKKLIKNFGFTVIEAPEEADTQLATLSQQYKNNIVGILTNDTDVLLYGGKNMLSNLSLSNNIITEYNKIKILNHFYKEANKIRENYNLKKIDCFLHENFLDFSILLGSDYKANIDHKEIELKNIEDQQKLFTLFVINNLNVELLINSLKNDKTNSDILIPDNYYENWKAIKNVYVNAKVFKPDKLTTDIFNIHKPNIDNIIEIITNENTIDNITLNEHVNIIKQSYLIFSEIIENNKKQKIFSNFGGYQYKYYTKKIDKLL
jgi:5'-3' exonuclease